MPKGWLLLPLLLSAVAQAATPAEELVEGLRLYNALDYQAAAPHLQVAFAAEQLPANDRALAGLYLGIVQLALGDEPTASATFRAALALDWRLQAPKDAAPKIHEMIEAVRGEVPPPIPVERRPTAPPPGTAATGAASTSAQADPPLGELSTAPTLPPESLEAPPAAAEPAAFYASPLFWGGVAGVVVGVVVIGGLIVTGVVLLGLSAVTS